MLFVKAFLYVRERSAASYRLNDVTVCHKYLGGSTPSAAIFFDEPLRYGRSENRRKEIRRDSHVKEP